MIDSTIKIKKKSADTNIILGKKSGEPLAKATFGIYDYLENDKEGTLITKVTTDENGETNVKLKYGKYIIKEIASPEHYLNNSTPQIVNIENENEIILVEFEDQSVYINLKIDKNGIMQAQPNDEIKYNFSELINNSNVSLDNFTWSDNLPYEYINITKLFTGTYNQESNYTVWYKTNLKDYVQFNNPRTENGTYSTLVNNCIDFNELKLDNINEYITDFKVDFGTVEAGFKAQSKPFIFCKVRNSVKPDDKWINKTKLEGDYTSNKGNKTHLEDKASWETCTYFKRLQVKKLPKTRSIERNDY